MSKRVAIINPVGFDGLGSETLCVEYAKLGLDVWFYSAENISSSTINIYHSSAELFDIAKNYDRLIFINLWFGVDIPDTVLDDLLVLRADYPSLELCYIYCARGGHLMDKLLVVCDRKNFMFDKVFTLSGALKDFNRCPTVTMKLNAITIPEYSPKDFTARKQIVFTSGRVASFKGTVKYFQSVTSEFLSKTKGFSYIHEGANFSFHKNDNGVSSSITLMSLFDTTKHPKEVKPEYTFKRYGEEPQSDKLNIYGEYNRDGAISRWSNYFAGICCILGTTSRYMKGNLLFDDEFVLPDSREQNAIEKAALLWNADLEYADIEKLIAGVPLFISRRYAKLIGFTDERLIYNCFLDIPDKVVEIVNCYDEVREAQWQWFVNSTISTNATILEEFTK